MILSRATPESQGVPSEAIMAFLDAAEQTLDALHSVIIVKDGAVVAEGWWSPHRAEMPHVLYSLSKSFASTAAGLAASEQHFDLADTVLSFFPDDAPAEISANLAAMTVRDLLMMATGHETDTTDFMKRDPDGNWVRAFLARPVERTPGTHFVYNSGATYMVSAIVQKTTGQTLLDYLTPRLFAPLGIEGATWESCPRGVNIGGWGLSIRTEDIAKFGQLYLQNGKWRGVPILPDGWVAEATAKQVSNGDNPDNDWNQGYGYQFWRCRFGAYRGDGAFGQFCIVLPAQNAVIAITSGLSNMGAVLALVWEHLLPALQRETMMPLPENPAASAALAERLSRLTRRGPTGSATSPRAARVSGVTYTLTPTESDTFNTVAFNFGNDSAVRLTLGDGTVDIGTNGVWLSTPAPLQTAPGYGRRVAATGAWESDDVFAAALAFPETPFSTNFRVTFSDAGVEIETRDHVSFGTPPTERRAGKIEVKG